MKSLTQQADPELSRDYEEEYQRFLRYFDASNEVSQST